jgi:uncharacterized repeat protein (TIGR03847 family)
MSTVADSFDFPDAQVFWTGADGPPGERVFFLAGGTNGEVVFLRCEKQQVAALAEYLRALLEDLSPIIDPTKDLGEVSPVDYSWTVGSIGVAYDSDRERIVVVLEEHTDEDDPATARFTFSFSQAAAFSDYALDLVSKGRPNCKLCGEPLDPEGHSCPRLN